MRALRLEDRRLSVRDDVPIPEPPSGEARVRVLRAGICNTDMELTRGYYPFTGIHARYPLAQAVTAFEQAQRPGVLKVLLDIG